MRKRLLWIALLLGCCVAAPIWIGATCAPPSTPWSLPITTSEISTGDSIIAACSDPGSVCISLNNQAIIPVEFSLYYEDGFDIFNRYFDPPSFSCCTNPNSTTACPCPCDGRDEGECELNRAELFRNLNLQTINGQQVVTLNPGISTLERVQCGDIKTMGVAIAKTGGDPINAPDYEEGPWYRQNPDRPESEDIPCGETIEFRVVNLNDASAGNVDDPELAILVIEVHLSTEE